MKSVIQPALGNRSHHSCHRVGDPQLLHSMHGHAHTLRPNMFLISELDFLGTCKPFKLSHGDDIFQLTLQFRQHHCLCTTELRFLISSKILYLFIKMKREKMKVVILAHGIIYNETLNENN